MEFQTKTSTDTENRSTITFTPTGESATEGRVSLAPLDFSAAMKGLLKTRSDSKGKGKR